MVSYVTEVKNLEFFSWILETVCSTSLWKDFREILKLLRNLSFRGVWNYFFSSYIWRERYTSRGRTTVSIPWGIRNVDSTQEGKSPYNYRCTEKRFWYAEKVNFYSWWRYSFIFLEFAYNYHYGFSWVCRDMSILRGRTF